MPKIRLRPDGEDYTTPDATTPPAVDLALDGQIELSTTDSSATITESAVQHETEASQSETVATPVPHKPEVMPSAHTLPALVLPDAAQEMSIHEAMTSDMTPTKEMLNPNESDNLNGGTIGSSVSGADLLLPLIIFAIVKSNPARLVSHLLYIQRYRTSLCATGEANYVTVNVTAAVEFLENVDLADLGLSSAEKVMRWVKLSTIVL
jgi:hypothetical protein